MIHHGVVSNHGISDNVYSEKTGVETQVKNFLFRKFSSFPFYKSHNFRGDFATLGVSGLFWYSEPLQFPAGL
jgi:hypothetical protein